MIVCVYLKASDGGIDDVTDDNIGLYAKIWETKT